jgi:hypothetical protein
MMDHFAEEVEIAKGVGDRFCGLHSRSWGGSLASDQGESGRPFEWRGGSMISLILCLSVEGYENLSPTSRQDFLEFIHPSLNFVGP